jgi:hypothetical protein
MMRWVRDNLNIVFGDHLYDQVVGLDWTLILLLVLVARWIWIEVRPVEPETSIDLRTKRLSRLGDFISNQLTKAGPTTPFTRILCTSDTGNEKFVKIPIAEVAPFLAEESIRGVILELFPNLNHRDYNFVFAVSADSGQGKTAYLRCLSEIRQWSDESRKECYDLCKELLQNGFTSHLSLMDRDVESALTQKDRQLVLQSALKKVDQWFETQFAKWVFIGISFHGSSGNSSRPKNTEFPVEARILHSLQNDFTP